MRWKRRYGRSVCTAACLTVAALSGLLACREQPPGVEVARVGDEGLTVEDIESRIPVHLTGKVTAQEKRRLAQGWVEEALLYQEALSRKLDEDPDVAARVSGAVRNMLTAELLEREFQRDSDILEGDYHNYYEAHKEDFVREHPEIRARHILVRNRSDLDRVRDRLKGGDLFDLVAREVSIDASAEAGGDLGYFTENMVNLAFWERCEKARAGRPVVAETRLGHHLIEVLDRREAGTIPDLLEVRGEIRQRILAERRQARREALLSALRERIPWSLHLEKLGDDGAE